MAEIVTYDRQGFRSAHRRVKRLHDRGRRRHDRVDRYRPAVDQHNRDWYLLCFARGEHLQSERLLQPRQAGVHTINRLVLLMIADSDEEEHLIRCCCRHR